MAPEGLTVDVTSGVKDQADAAEPRRPVPAGRWKRHLFNTAVAVVLTAAVALLRWWLNPVLGPRAAFTPFFPLVIAVGWWLGLWPAILTAALATAAATLLFVGARGVSLLSTTAEQMQVLTNVLALALCVLVTEAAQRARRRMAEHERSLEQRTESLRLVSEAAAGLLAASDPEEMVVALFEKVRGFLGADAFFNYRLDTDCDPPVLRLEAAGGLPDAARAAFAEMKLGEAVCGSCALERRVLYFPAIQSNTEPRLGLARSMGARAYVCYPLIAGDRLIGTLSFGSRTKDTFEAHELELMQTVSHYVAIAHQRLHAERTLRAARSELLLVTDTMAAPVIRLNRDLRYLWANRAYAEHFCATTPKAMEGRHVGEMIGEQALAKIRPYIERVLRGERVEYEAELNYRILGPRWVHVIYTPTHDAAGAVDGFVGHITDVTDRKRVEEILARDKETLERLVTERTGELARTYEKLRMSERMATIGTLSAGLGHDIANLLLPVRMRLETIDIDALPENARECIAAMRTAGEYLQKLSGSLRLLALDPRQESSRHEATDLAAWWAETEAMIRNAIPKSIALVAQIPEGLPHARAGRPGLTQAVFNLVQNAGQALADTDGGTVWLTATTAGADHVQLVVRDNGPGMTEDVRRRCLEPFFTTKSRGVGSGLGLALVAGIVQRADGSVQIDSAPGRGATFTMTFPRARAVAREHVNRGVAVITVKDERQRAVVKSTLESLAYEVSTGESPESADLWVVEEDAPGNLDRARRFVDSGPGRQAIVVAERSDTAGSSRIACIEPGLKLSLLRERIRSAVLEAPGPI